MKGNQTIEDVLEDITVVNTVYMGHRSYVEDFAMRTVYRMCREDIIKTYELDKGEYNMFYNLVRKFDKQ